MDRGQQFTSSLWFQLCEMLNISHKQTTAYHPESNGAVERLHHRLKDALCACAAAATWSQELPFVLLRLRAQPREDTGFPQLRQSLVFQLACTAADATSGSPRRCSRPPGSRPGSAAATKWVLFADPLVSSPPSPALPQTEVFAHPGPAAHSQPPQTRYPSCQRAPPKRLDLFSSPPSSQGQSSGGALWRAAYAPGDG
jgi:hypothetical protein